MNNPSSNEACDELAWIKSYMDMTGVTEIQARSVFMYVCCNDTSKLDIKDIPAIDYSASRQKIRTAMEG